MVLPNSGTLSFSQIQTEFGGTNPINLSEYYTNAAGAYTAGISGIPVSGEQINISMFFGKSSDGIIRYDTVVNHIDDIPYSTFSSVSKNVFYLRYNLNVNGSPQTITVSCRKSSTYSKITQSCFTLAGNSLIVDTAAPYTQFVNNDDMDTLYMDGTGSGFIARNDTNQLYDASGYGKITFNGSVISFDANNNNPQGYPGSGTFTWATVVAFPATSKTLYFTGTNYIINGFSSQSWSSTVSSYLSGWTSNSTPGNKLTTVSDGVNSVLIIWNEVLTTPVTTGVYVTFNLSTGVMISATNITFSDSFVWSSTNSTEEDAIGNQLFAIDGGISYYKDSNYYYTTDATTGYSFLERVVPASSTSIGTLNTQTGMDLLTAIDTSDGYAYFLDWGHDNGGLFNFGNDDTLGYAKTNIFKIPSLWSGIAPSKVVMYSLTNITGNIYQFTSVNNFIRHIDDIPYSVFNSISSNKFYLKYNILTNSGTQTIIVACRKSTTYNKITQSCFSLNGSTLSYGTARGYGWLTNDDMDTLYMDGTGSGFIARNNTNQLYDASGYGKITFNNSNISFDANNNNPQGYPGSGTFTWATVVAFPATSKTLYFTGTNYIINGFSSQSWSSTVSSYLSGWTTNSTPANTLTTVSDGVNSVLIIWNAVFTTPVTSGVYVTFNLETGVMISAKNITFADSFVWSSTNSTEEDAIGNQLFAIDGGISYYKDSNYYYTTDATAGYSFLERVVPASSTSIGTLNTQTGMDLLTAIDTSDGYAYFLDWGHDNGGLFNFGNDDTFGFTKTNIFKIPNNFTGESPSRTAF